MTKQEKFINTIAAAAGAYFGFMLLKAVKHKATVDYYVEKHKDEPDDVAEEENIEGVGRVDVESFVGRDIWLNEIGEIGKKGYYSARFKVTKQARGKYKITLTEWFGDTIHSESLVGTEQQIDQIILGLLKKTK